MLYIFNLVFKGVVFDIVELFKENDELYCEKVEFDGKVFVVCVIVEV